MKNENCVHDVSRVEKFCHECGVPVKVVEPFTCVGCNRAVLEGDKFCSWCGDKL